MNRRKSSLLLFIFMFMFLSFLGRTFAHEEFFNEWKNSFQNVSPNKTWTVSFNQEIDPSTATNVNIFVTNENGKKLDNEIRIKNGRTVSVLPPRNGYEPGKRYTLFIKDILSADTRKKIASNTQMTFFVAGEISVSKYQFTADSVKIDSSRTPVIINQTEKTLQLQKAFYAQNQIRQGTVIFVLPHEDFLEGFSGKVLSIIEKADSVLLFLEDIPFYELFESFQVEGYVDDFHVNTALESVEGVSVRSRPIYSDGIKYEEITFNFENTEVSVDENGQFFFEPRRRGSVQGILSGQIQMIMPGVDVDINFNAWNIHKGFDAFDRLDISVNPRILVDLELEITSTGSQLSSYQGQELNILTVPVPKIPGLTVEINMKPYANMKTISESAGKVQFHFETGVRLGIRKAGSSFESYQVNDNTKSYLRPDLTSKVNAEIDAGCNLSIGLRFAKKVAEVSVNNYISVNSNGSLEMFLQDPYQLDSRGNNEWMRGTMEIALVYRPTVYLQAIGLKKQEYDLAEHELLIYDSKITGIRELIDVQFDNSEYQDGSVVAAHALYRNAIIMDGFHYRKIPLEIGKLQILPLNKPYDQERISKGRKIILHPEGSMTLDENTGILSLKGRNRKNLKIELDFFGHQDFARVKISASEKRVFYEVMKTMYETLALPDGLTLLCPSGDIKDDTFAIYDIDQDGKDELIIRHHASCSAGMIGLIYNYDPTEERVKLALQRNTSFEFYNNGILKVKESKNHSLAENFWPYELYRHNKQTDVYDSIAYVEGWEKDWRPDLFTYPFPEHLDLDQDGTVYIVRSNSSGSENQRIMDGKEYQNWIEGYVENSTILTVPYLHLTAFNLEKILD